MKANHRASVLFTLSASLLVASGCSDDACEGKACLDTVAAPGTTPDAGDSDDNDNDNDEDRPSDEQSTEPTADGGAINQPSMDASIDAGPGEGESDAGDGDGDVEIDAGAFPSLTVEEFCQRSLAPGKAWADKLNECCSTNALESWEQEQLLWAFGHPSLRFGDGAELCAQNVKEMLDKGVVFHPEYAGACAHLLAANYELEPPATCPAGDGFYVPEILGKVGKAAQTREQIAVCRQTFVGNLAAGAECELDLQCGERGVCERDINGSRCVSAREEGERCLGTQECAAGLYCEGLLGGYRICSKKSRLGKIGAACNAHSECSIGMWCNKEINQCDPVPKQDTMSVDGERCASGPTIFNPHFQCKGYCDSSSSTGDICAPFCAK
jgi:hypothetical protein